MMTSRKEASYLSAIKIYESIDEPRFPEGAAMTASWAPRFSGKTIPRDVG